MPRHAVHWLLIFIIIVVAHTVLVQADDSSLPWCQQPSGVALENRSRSGYTWTTEYGHGPDGIRPIYQEYNHRIILMTSNTRDVVQIIDEGIDTNRFELRGYSSDCRYMAGTLGEYPARIQTVIWDLSTHPATRLGSFDNGVYRPHQLDWSPDGRFVIVSTRNAVFLWNLATNTQTELVADAVSDCYRSMRGCTGTTYAHAGLEWDTATGVVRVNLNRVGYTVTFDLNNGQPIGYTERSGAAVTQAEAQTVEGRVESPYGCVPDVQYQTYNQRLVLKDRVTGDLLEVMEDSLNLARFQFLGWSATCQYIAAAIDAGTGLELTAWNIGTHARTTMPISDHMDDLSWSPVGNVGLVQTDGEGAFLWNIDTNQQFPLSAVGADGSSIHQFAWRAERNLLLAVTASAPNVVTAYNVFNGQVVATFDNQSASQAGFSIIDTGKLLIGASSEDTATTGVFSLWNLDNHSVLRFSTTLSNGRNLYRGWHISPSGRYLYSIRYTPYNGISYQPTEFWDLQSLNESEPHPPTTILDFGETWQAHFVDEHIVESYTSDATQFEVAACIKYRTAYRWDVRTSELLSETPILRDGC